MKQEHNITKPRAIALGFFDGVHTGHGELLRKVAEKAPTATPTALTFDRHPGSVLGTQKVPLLSTVSDRKWMMETYYHIESVVVADFSAIMSMDWEDFIQNYLQTELGVTSIVAGHDFRFGKGGAGNAEKLQEKCKELGIHCEIVAPVTLDQVIISSTHIRSLMEQGEMGEAVHFLGHPHILSNQVKHGNKIGGKVLGYPTVNLEVPEDIITPTYGVYACRVWVENTPYFAVTNIGIRPTITENNAKNVTIEGFLLDFPHQELYGTTLRMEFYHFIRGEQKFDSLEELTQQITKDVDTTRLFFQENTVV